MTDAELEVEMASVYHPNDRIEAALAALDKMLNLPFEVFENNEIRDSTGTAIAEVWIRKKYDAHDVAELFARSPDLAAEVIRLRKIIATLSRGANKLEMDGVARMSAEERGKWLDKQVEEIETRDENIAEGYGLERKWFADAQED